MIKAFVKKVAADKNGGAYINARIVLDVAEQSQVLALAREHNAPTYSTLTGNVFGIPTDKAEKLNPGDTLTVVAGTPSVRISYGAYEAREGKAPGEGYNVTVDMRGCKLSCTAVPMAECDW